MFWLPTSKQTDSAWPLGDHAGLLLASGLLSEDLDDRHDKLYAAMQIDPVLAAWTVHRALELDSFRVRDLHAASRWLSQQYLRALYPPDYVSSLVAPRPQHRASWRRMVVDAVATARLAARLITTNRARTVERAYLLGQLFHAKYWLETAAAPHGKTFCEPSESWPKWVNKKLKRIERRCSSKSEAVRAVQAAVQQLAEDRLLAERLVSDEERRLWFRPYPEMQSSLAQLLVKLQRLDDLESHFAACLEREKLASLQQLAYGASHEINNPLANISTRAQTLLHSETNADRRRKLTAINRQAFRAHEMIADLMLFAKPPRLETQLVDVQALLTGVVDELTQEADEHGARMILEPAMKTFQIRADPTQLAVAVKAICINAMEAMGTGGTVQLIVEEEEGNLVEVIVRDTGPGIGHDTRRHLFDPFYSGREAGRGLGFGLSKAWRIIDQHDGEICVESRLGKGATFRLRLPPGGPNGQSR